MIRVIYLPNERDGLGMGGVWAPAFVCDACGKHIESHGNYCFTMNEDRRSSDVLTAHKGTCTNEVEQRIRADGGLFGWDEIHLLPDRLALNLSLPSA